MCEGKFKERIKPTRELFYEVGEKSGIHFSDEPNTKGYIDAIDDEGNAVKLTANTTFVDMFPSVVASCNMDKEKNNE